MHPATPVVTRRRHAGPDDAAARARRGEAPRTERDAAAKALAAQDAGCGQARRRQEGRADKKAAAKKAIADKKALADKKAAAAKKLADADKAAAEEEARSRAPNPARIWVQVAGGANEGDLPKAWAKVKAKAPTVFGARSGWTTPLRATNRVLAGPFKTDAEARAFVNQLAKEGVSAFAFTSDAGPDSHEAAGQVSDRAPWASDPARSRGRLHEEQSGSARGPRDAFQRDRDRIIHSISFRRLRHKTQVFMAPDGDHFRVRLTHSLEVAQIGRTIARALGLNEDLTEALCLAHDIGHPPFGHAGEDALKAALAGQGGFDHNGHTLRALTRSSGPIRAGTGST